MGLLRRLLPGVLLACVSATVLAQPLPRLVSRDVKHALIVDGAPFLIRTRKSSMSKKAPSKTAAGS